MKEIWNKLQNFKVSQGTEKLTFIKRLARENGWSLTYAERVYKEYLKFIYLAVTSSKNVTPSDEVDQVWHLHLCYSTSYWNDLCGSLLKKKLHHGPTKGGKIESDRFFEQYENTLNLYKDCFGSDAPSDIWPSPTARFNAKNRFTRINLNESFVVKKRSVYLVSSLLLGALFLSGCEKFFNDAIDGNPMDIFLIVLGIVFAIWLIRKLAKNSRGGDGGGCGGFWGCGSGCSGCGGGCGD